MHSIIQNLACFEILVTDGGHRFYFDNFLKDKIVKNLFFYFTHEDLTARNPLLPFENGSLIPVTTDFANFDLYVTLVSDSKKTIVNNLNYKNISRYTIELLTYPNTPNIVFDINSKLDLESSFITINYDNEGPTANILMFVEYFTDKAKYNHNGNSITGSVTIDFPAVANEADEHDFKLSDYVKYTLQGRKIKKIEPRYFRGQLDVTFEKRDGLMTFLDLKCKNNLFDSLPLSILTSFDQSNQIWFDDIEIDFDNSFLKYRSPLAPVSTSLTFYY